MSSGACRARPSRSRRRGGRRAPDLQGRRGSEEFGDALDDGAGERDRRRRTGDGHGVDVDRHPVAGEGDVVVERGPVELQRRGRGEDRRDPRPLLEALEVARHRLADAADGGRVARRVDEGHVLARLGEQCEVLDELALLERHVRGGDLRHIRSSCGNSSFSPVVSRRSCSVLARRSPVRKSSVLATQPLGAKWKGSPSSSTTSSSGSRPRTPRVWGTARAPTRPARAAGERFPVASSTRGAPGRKLRQDGRAGQAHAHAGEQFHRLVGDPALLCVGQPGGSRSHRVTPFRDVMVVAAPAVQRSGHPFPPPESDVKKRRPVQMD